MIATRRIFAAALAALGALAVASQAAWAQSYPDRNIRLIVPFAAGGNADINGRVVADVVHKALGQPVVVENRAGAGGGVGAEHVARAEPDGYTLLVGSNGPLTINPILNPNISYDSLKDFAAVALVSYVPHVLDRQQQAGGEIGRRPGGAVQDAPDQPRHQRRRQRRPHDAGALQARDRRADRACALQERRLAAAGTSSAATSTAP